TRRAVAAVTAAASAATRATPQLVRGKRRSTAAGRRRARFNRAAGRRRRGRNGGRRSVTGSGGTLSMPAARSSVRKVRTVPERSRGTGTGAPRPQRLRDARRVRGEGAPRSVRGERAPGRDRRVRSEGGVGGHQRGAGRLGQELGGRVVLHPQVEFGGRLCGEV